VSEKLRRQLARLQEGVYQEAQEAYEDEHERQKRLKTIREAAEQEIERFFRELTRDG
jgi:hypothetical protein